MFDYPNLQSIATFMVEQSSTWSKARQNNSVVTGRLWFCSDFLDQRIIWAQCGVFRDLKKRGRGGYKNPASDVVLVTHRTDKELVYRDCRWENDPLWTLYFVDLEWLNHAEPQKEFTPWTTWHFFIILFQKNWLLFLITSYLPFKPPTRPKLGFLNGTVPSQTNC